ncbi:hypothetical protein ACP70R_011155 [Stipagrostis hirtigluma subsp. patula]
MLPGRTEEEDRVRARAMRPPMAGRGGALALVAAALCLLLQLAAHGAAEPLVPAVFVFGDSTVDVGNNNYLNNCSVECRADHPSYGVDYDDGAPTGRFSNGYNLADQLAQLLGFQGSPPPFLPMTNASRIQQMSSTGINFASGGSGLLVRTGLNVCGEVFPMAEQVRSFADLARQWGDEDKTAAERISRSLVFISVGSNDLFEFSDAGPPSPSHNDTAFLQDLIAYYTSYLKGLYGAGARRFSVVSPSLVGCCPSQRAVARKGNAHDVDEFGCFGEANGLSGRLYPMIESMLQGLVAELPGMNYSLGDSIGMAKSVINNTNNHTPMPGLNFTVLDRACCGAGEFGEGGCSNNSVPLCASRGNYLFWDKFHPTEAASRVTAEQLFAGSSFVHPISVQQLVAPPP